MVKILPNSLLEMTELAENLFNEKNYLASLKVA